MYEVELSAEAQRFYDRADTPVARKLARCFVSLEKRPREGNNVKPLKGKFATASAISAWSTRSTIAPSSSS